MNGRVLHVVGTRPNFVKAAPVVAALRTTGHDQVLVHTGQHYDERMSRRRSSGSSACPSRTPTWGSAPAATPGRPPTLLVALEGELDRAAPAALVVVYGDVNSTLAAALVRAKLGIPVAHVEAGLRSFDMTMPEEVNRRARGPARGAAVRDQPRGRRTPRPRGR